MQKIKIIVAVLLVVALLAGCAGPNGDKAGMSNARKIPNEINQLEVSPHLSFQSKFPFYNAGTMRIWMELENGGAEKVRFPDEYFLEIKTEKGWESPLIDTKNDFGQVDAGGVQFPIEYEEIREIGVYLGALGIYDEEYGAYRIPCGIYRITMVSDTQDKVVAEFEISNNEPEDTRLYYIKTVLPAYGKDTEEIKYEVINDSDEELYYGAAFHLEQYVNNKWKVYPMTKEHVGFDDMAYIIPRHSTIGETISLGEYYQLPMKIGKYRLVKQLDVYQNSYAEFTME